jgi:hypothetical protein
MTHPDPLSAGQVASALRQAAQFGRNLAYNIGEEGTKIDVIVATCIYGFPSCVMVEYSIGSGVKAYSWSPYGLELGAEKQPYYDALCQWVAETITSRATYTLPDKHPNAPLTIHSTIAQA